MASQNSFETAESTIHCDSGGIEDSIALEGSLKSTTQEVLLETAEFKASDDPVNTVESTAPHDSVEAVESRPSDDLIKTVDFMVPDGSVVTADTTAPYTLEEQEHSKLDDDSSLGQVGIVDNSGILTFIKPFKIQRVTDVHSYMHPLYGSTQPLVETTPNIMDIEQSGSDKLNQTPVETAPNTMDIEQTGLDSLTLETVSNTTCIEVEHTGLVDSTQTLMETTPNIMEVEQSGSDDLTQGKSPTDVMEEDELSINTDMEEKESIESLANPTFQHLLSITRRLNKVAEDASDDEFEVIDDETEDPTYFPESDGDSTPVTPIKGNGPSNEDRCQEVMSSQKTTQKTPKVQSPYKNPQKVFEEIVDVSQSLDEIPKLHYRSLDKDEILKDSDIYLKFFKHASVTKKGKTKTTVRPYDIVHACRYCGELRTNIQIHLEKVHKDKPGVVDIVQRRDSLNKEIRAGREQDKREIKEKMKVLKGKQDLLQYEGDHLHNVQVIKEKHGEIILGRRPTDIKDFNHQNFGPCPGCLMWLTLSSSVSRHQTFCPATIQDSTTGTPEMDHPVHFSTKSFIFSSQIAAGRYVGSSQYLKKHVYPSMRRDELSDIAQTDPLITPLGDEWFVKGIDNKLKRKKYASFHMRQAAWIWKLKLP